jgi:hypothetical protein
VTGAVLLGFAGILAYGLRWRRRRLRTVIGTSVEAGLKRRKRRSAGSRGVEEATFISIEPPLVTPPPKEP